MLMNPKYPHFIVSSFFQFHFTSAECWRLNYENKTVFFPVLLADRIYCYPLWSAIGIITSFVSPSVRLSVSNAVNYCPIWCSRLLYRLATKRTGKKRVEENANASFLWHRTPRVYWFIAHYVLTLENLKRSIFSSHLSGLSFGAFIRKNRMRTSRSKCTWSFPRRCWMYRSNFVLNYGTIT